LIGLDTGRTISFDICTRSIHQKWEWRIMHHAGRIGLFVALSVSLESAALPAAGGPYDGSTFRGRIAYSSDGNHNDPDDWAASPMALAIFAEFGAADHLVHFDYNCILPQTDPEWEAIHKECVLGAAERYGYDLSVFHDCRDDLDAAVASIAAAINTSSADDPLYFVIAGPMEVPYLGIEKSDPARRKYVYCISHSQWNDGFARRYTFTHTKRSVIPTGVNWVQIRDQNRLLSRARYGQPAQPQEFAPYFWMRDSDDPRVRFLWERMQVSTRPDPSDAGMAYFLMTGDEEADPAKLERLLDKNSPPAPITERDIVRLEAENFEVLEGYELEFVNDRSVSHRLCIRLAEGDGTGMSMIRTRFDQPYTTASGRYDVDIRYLFEEGGPTKLGLLVNGDLQGEAWRATIDGEGWKTHTIGDVPIRRGDKIALMVLVEEYRSGIKLDYVQLNAHQDASDSSTALAVAGPAPHPRFAVTGPLDDPAALPGQVIIAGENPGHLKYNGGKPIYLAGPDNPEDFLYLGELSGDGTRSGGPQEEIIEFLGQSGANAFHFQLTRMRSCNVKDEGDDTHVPFIDHDPAKPLNEKVLDQWEAWLTALEAAGVIVHLEFFNDATDVERMGWTLGGEGNLHPHERRWIEGVVQRFKHHRNIIWGIEESCNKLPRDRTEHFKKIAQLIAETDNHNHPIVQSFVTLYDPDGDPHPDGVTSDDYVGDPHIGIVTWLHLLPHGEDVEAQHAEYLRHALLDGPRFVVMKNETHYHRVDRTTSRRQAWACVLTGMHAMEAQHNATRANRRDRILDDGRIVTFMDQTDWITMKPRDDLATGSTKWVLANPGVSYIAYTYDYDGPMGVWRPTAGTFDLLWFDTATGQSVKQAGVPTPPGEAGWTKPDRLGSEIALYARLSDGE
jgi:hypothetical protein